MKESEKKLKELGVICFGVGQKFEGKILGEDLNRAIYDNDGRILDIIAGKFFICYAPLESEKFLSLPDDMLKKYQEKFKYPERITLIDERIIVKPVKPLSKEMER